MSAPQPFPCVLHEENDAMRAHLARFEADMFFEFALFHFDPSGILPEIIDASATMPILSVSV